MTDLRRRFIFALQRVALMLLAGLLPFGICVGGMHLLTSGGRSESALGAADFDKLVQTHFAWRRLDGVKYLMGFDLGRGVGEYMVVFADAPQNFMEEATPEASGLPPLDSALTSDHSLLQSTKDWLGTFQGAVPLDLENVHTVQYLDWDESGYRYRMKLLRRSGDRVTLVIEIFERSSAPEKTEDVGPLPTAGTMQGS